MKNERLKYSLIFAALGALFFVSFLGGVNLFDWDEINFAEASREMIVLKDYLHVNIDFKAFWEKPPLFFWLQVISMKMFGVGEFAARFPNAVCGVIVLVLLFNLGTKLHNIRFGIIWAMAYFGSVLPHLYFKSGIIDPWFNLFIFLGIYYIIQFQWNKNGFETGKTSKNGTLYLLAAGTFLGLAILTKGPVALLVTGLVLFVYWIYKQFRFFISPFEFLIFMVVASVVPAIWFGVETAYNGPWFVQAFIKYQYRLFSTPDAGHGGFPGFHPTLLLVGCFPASIFCVRSFFNWQKADDNKIADFRVWMMILFWVVLILFITVQSKIVHYSSLCYYPLTYLAATVIERIIEKQIKFTLWMKFLMTLVALLYIIALVAAPIVGRNIEMLKPYIDDEFTRANMDAQVNWTGWEVLPGILVLLTLIFFFYLQKRNDSLSLKPFVFLFGSMASFVLITLIFYVNRIEAYSQRAAIDFFVERQREDCYVLSHGYKTYADLYYTDKQPTQDTNSVFRMMYYGGNTKPIYVITKINKEHEIDVLDGLNKIGSKNGFVFFRKEPSLGGQQ